MENARVVFRESPDTGLSVRTFQIEERINAPFRIVLTAMTPNESLDLGRLVGHRVTFVLVAGRPRSWECVCTEIQFLRTSETAEGLATYGLVLRPVSWALGERKNSRLFQHISIPKIVTTILEEWSIAHEWQLAPDAYPDLELRTQFEESDLAFITRLLEEAGISFWFRNDEQGTTMVLGDAPHVNEERIGTPLAFVDDSSLARSSRAEFVTAVCVHEESRPGRVTLRDYDFSRARTALFARFESDRSEELAHEQYLFAPGASLSEGSAAGSLLATPVADDLGTARFREARLAARAKLEIEALHADRKVVRFETSAADLAPGVVFRIANHPRPDLATTESLLALTATLVGEVAKPDEWRFSGVAAPTDRPYRPRKVTPKPRVFGILNAVVVGPTPNPTGSLKLPGATGRLANTPLSTGDTAASLPDNDIYVDEHGRVRVQFPWDRDNDFGAMSSIWMRVSQGWAGSGYGLFTIPRVGHEVLVAFINGDPDCPVVVGRVHDSSQPTPFSLPENKTVSTWKTASSPGGGGFNELRFDDAAGREHVYMQAQKDMDVLVKNDAKAAIGGDASRFVQNDDGIAVGHDRTKFVNMNELEATGLNKVGFVGLNQSRSIGAEDSTIVGSRWSVTVARGLTTRMVKELDRVAAGLGGVMRGAATGALGGIGGNPLASLADGALTSFGRKTFERLADLLERGSGFATEPGPAQTSIEVVDRKITFTTGEASLVLDGPNVTIHAQGSINVHSIGDTAVLSERELALAGREKTALVSATDDLILQAAKDLHLNPYAAGGNLEPATTLEGDPVADALRCHVCSSPLVLGPEGWLCPEDATQEER
jgi:type VI secretion system secreted protein VgrG